MQEAIDASVVWFLKRKVLETARRKLGRTRLAMALLQALEQEDASRCSLSALLPELVEHWKAHPDSGEEEHAGSSDEEQPPKQTPIKARSPPTAITDEQARALTPAFDRTRTGRAALSNLLADLNLAALNEPLKSETLLSCFIRLEHRPDFLARLKELGVSALPQRQKLANALSKAKRAEATDTSADAGDLRCLLLPNAPSWFNGLLVTASGATLLLNTSTPPSRRGNPIAVDGPFARLAAKMASVAHFHLVVLPSLPLEEELDSAVAQLASALGCEPSRVVVFLAGRRDLNTMRFTRPRRIGRRRWRRHSCHRCLYRCTGCRALMPWWRRSPQPLGTTMERSDASRGAP